MNSFLYKFIGLMLIIGVGAVIVTGPLDIYFKEKELLPKGVVLSTYAQKQQAEGICLKLNDFLKNQKSISDNEVFTLFSDKLLGFSPVKDFPYAGGYLLRDSEAIVEFKGSEYVGGVCFLKFKDKENGTPLNFKFYDVDKESDYKQFGFDDYIYNQFLYEFKKFKTEVERKHKIKSAEVLLKE